ncbi:MAG: DinB family protein [Acidobacteriota bacterium]
MSKDQALRRHVLYLLGGGGAHLDFGRVIGEWPLELRGQKVERVPYSPWQILEHMRIAQWDILQFSVSPGHVSPKFPGGYWPDAEVPAEGAWERTVDGFQSDLEAMRDLVADPSADLYAPFSHGKGQTLLREALLVVDHNAYHLGQLVLLRRLLGGWKTQGSTL